LTVCGLVFTILQLRRRLIIWLGRSP